MMIVRIVEPEIQVDPPVPPPPAVRHWHWQCFTSNLKFCQCYYYCTSTSYTVWVAAAEVKIPGVSGYILVVHCGASVRAAARCRASGARFAARGSRRTGNSTFGSGPLSTSSRVPKARALGLRRRSGSSPVPRCRRSSRCVSWGLNESPRVAVSLAAVVLASMLSAARL